MVRREKEALGKKTSLKKNKSRNNTRYKNTYATEDAPVPYFPVVFPATMVPQLAVVVWHKSGVGTSVGAGVTEGRRLTEGRSVGESEGASEGTVEGAREGTREGADVGAVVLTLDPASRRSKRRAC